MSGSAQRTVNSNPTGQGLVEYVLILSLVAIAVIGGLALLGPQLGNTFGNVVSLLAPESLADGGQPQITGTPVLVPVDADASQVEGEAATEYRGNGGRSSAQSQYGGNASGGRVGAVAGGIGVGGGDGGSGGTGDTGGGSDPDGDGVAGTADNCAFIPNPDQTDSDSDGLGDVCDLTPRGNDADGDGILDSQDNCPAAANPSQADADGDGAGDSCDSTPHGSGGGSGGNAITGSTDIDSDADGINDADDNCPRAANPGQEDGDGDGVGDVCDAVFNEDGDGDGVLNARDNCPGAANPRQEDGDGDGFGDACDQIDCHFLVLGDASGAPQVFWSGRTMQAHIFNYSPADVYIQTVVVSYAWHPDDSSHYITWLRTDETTLWDEDINYVPGAPTRIRASREDGTLQGTTAGRRVAAGTGSQYLSLGYQNVDDLDQWAEPLRSEFGYAVTVTVGADVMYDADHPGTNGCVLAIGQQ